MHILPFSLKAFPPECDLVVATTYCQNSTGQTPIYSPHCVWERIRLQQLFLPWLSRRILCPNDNSFILQVRSKKQYILVKLWQGMSFTFLSMEHMTHHEPNLYVLAMCPLQSTCSSLVCMVSLSINLGILIYPNLDQIITSPSGKFWEISGSLGSRGYKTTGSRSRSPACSITSHPMRIEDLCIPSTVILELEN